MADLIERLERDGASRELDQLITRQVRTPDWRKRVGKEEIEIGDRGWVRDSRASDYLPSIHAHWPNYTTSIDAALSLVPKGCVWSVALRLDLSAEAIVWGHDLHESADAATPALALCIAALRARSTGGADER